MNEEEADESMYWMELLSESNLELPLKETDEIVVMTVSSITTVRRQSSRSK